jgi:proteasome lid subunit RPN8/RPN11
MINLKIKHRDLESIEKHALKTFPLECCGLLIGKTTTKIFDVKEIVTTENTHKSEVSFEVDAELVYRAITTAEAKGFEIVGIYHSHPNMRAFISAEDAKVMKLWPSVAWLVLGVSEKQIVEKNAFMLKENKIVELDIKID